MSRRMDAILQSWGCLQVFASPPFALNRHGLNKLRMSSGVEVTLIAPFWRQKEWFPDLVIDLPVILPCRKDLLRQPRFSQFCQNFPCFNFIHGDYRAIHKSSRIFLRSGSPACLLQVRFLFKVNECLQREVVLLIATLSMTFLSQLLSATLLSWLTTVRIKSKGTIGSYLIC